MQTLAIKQAPRPWEAGDHGLRVDLTQGFALPNPVCDVGPLATKPAQRLASFPKMTKSTLGKERPHQGNFDNRHFSPRAGLQQVFGQRKVGLGKPSKPLPVLHFACDVPLPLKDHAEPTLLRRGRPHTEATKSVLELT